MNNYLVLLGSKIPEIREWMGISQEELANMIGISRPTLIKLEADPTKLTKTIAYALFVALSFELKNRMRQLKEMETNDYSTPHNVEAFAKKLTSISGSVATAGAIGWAIGGPIGALAGSAFKAALSKGKVPKLPEIHWNQKTAKKTYEAIRIVLEQNEGKVMQAFGIQSFLDVETFVKKIEEGEKQKNN